MAEQIIIEFIAETSGLDSSNQKLEKQGKITHQNGEEFKRTNAEIIKQQKALEQIGAVTKKIDESGKVTRRNLADLAKIIKSQSTEFQAELKKGIIDSLKQAGASVEEFTELLENAISPSVKQQLRELTNELAKMKAEGKDNTEQYKAMAAEAGRLKDAIGDANQEVKNFGSDTSTLDGLLGVAQGLTGGFALAQGAAALFGDESEELQQTLLRVNAAMAILQGLQQIQTVLQKESAAATLVNTIAVKGRTAAQTALNFVIGNSTGLFKAFRIALASTGIGLLVIGIYQLVRALKEMGDEAKNAEDNMARLQAEISKNERLTNESIAAIRRRGEIAKEVLKQQGFTESQINQLLIKNLQEEAVALDKSANSMMTRIELLRREAIQNVNSLERVLSFNFLNGRITDLASAISFLDNIELFKLSQTFKDLSEEGQKDFENLVTSINAVINTFNEANNVRDQATIQGFQERTRQQEEFRKQQEEATRREKKRRAEELEDIKAEVQVRLLGAKEGSEEELKLKKELAAAQLSIDLNNENLTSNQRKLILRKFLKEGIDLQRDHNQRIGEDRLNSQLNLVQAELNQLDLSNDQKLDLQIEALQIQSELEIEAAEGNADKITLIESERDRKIREARLASIKETLDYELKATERNNAPTVRFLNKIIENEKKSVEERKRAIDELIEYEQDSIKKRIDALNKERRQKLISQQEYEDRYKDIIDDGEKAVKNLEDKKTDITKKGAEERKRISIEEIQTIAAATSEVIGVLDSLFQLQSSKETENIEHQKQELKDLQAAGAITEKEATVRQKKLEAEEKRIRQQQAQRDKQIAVFKALLAIPQAILQGLTTSGGGPILAAIYGALAAAQAAIVIARPIPKFGKGKKDKYEGFGEVAETGTELVEKDGKMYVVDKPQVIWLGKNDKVFNPQETEKMLTKSSMNTERPALTIEKKPFSIDYKKLGKEVGKHTSTTVYVDGYREQQIKKEAFIRDLNKRRSW